MVKGHSNPKKQHRIVRQRERKGLSLTDKVLSPGLHSRAAVAAARILRFLQESSAMPSTWEDVDVAAAQYLEHIFAKGYPKGYGSDGLAALQHFLPEVGGKLRHS